MRAATVTEITKPATAGLAQRGQHLPLVKPEEAPLVRPDLMHEDVVVPVVGVFLQLRDVAPGAGPQATYAMTIPASAAVDPEPLVASQVLS